MTATNKLKSYLNGDRLHVRYTFLSDDITEGEAPFGMPYRDRKGYFDENGYCEEAKANLVLSDFGGGIRIELTTQSEELSEIGLSFPFNFMGKKNGGGWRNQYLLNSPYTSEREKSDCFSQRKLRRLEMRLFFGVLPRTLLSRIGIFGEFRQDIQNGKP